MKSLFFKLEELSPSKLDSFDRNKTIFFITVSPLEKHGDHLPLGTDIFESNAVSNGLATKFHESHKDWNIVFCPAISMGMGAINGVGAINTRQYIIRDFLIDHFSGIAKRGFKYMFVSGFHGNPQHLTAIDESIIYVNRKYNSRIISPFGYCFTNIFYGKFNLPDQELNKLYKQNKFDIHAGLFETSLVMYVKPDLVNNYKGLEKVDLAVKNPIKKIQEFRRGLKVGYFGNPSDANQDLGKWVFDQVVDVFYDILIKSMTDDKLLKSLTNYYYKYPYMKTNFLKKFLFLLIGISSFGFYSYLKNKKKEM